MKYNFDLVWFLLQTRDEICSEYEQIKDILSTLSSLKLDSSGTPRNVRDEYSNRMPHSYQRYEEPTRDPDVWPPPTPLDRKYVLTYKIYNIPYPPPTPLDCKYVSRYNITYPTRHTQKVSIRHILHAFPKELI